MKQSSNQLTEMNKDDDFLQLEIDSTNREMPLSSILSLDVLGL